MYGAVSFQEEQKRQTHAQWQRRKHREAEGGGGVAVEGELEKVREGAQYRRPGCSEPVERGHTMRFVWVEMWEVEARGVWRNR
jgi:hypothetical protein